MTTTTAIRELSERISENHEAITLAITALKRVTPVKCTLKTSGDYRLYYCPTCGKVSGTFNTTGDVSFDDWSECRALLDPFCNKCGQAFDWGIPIHRTIEVEDSILASA